MGRVLYGTLNWRDQRKVEILIAEVNSITTTYNKRYTGIQVPKKNVNKNNNNNNKNNNNEGPDGKNLSKLAKLLRNVKKTNKQFYCPCKKV